MKTVIVLFILIVILMNSQGEGVSIGTYNYPVCQSWNPNLRGSKCVGFAAGAALSPPSQVTNMQQRILSSYIYLKAQSIAVGDITAQDNATVFAGTTLNQLATVFADINANGINSTYWNTICTHEIGHSVSIPTLSTIVYHIMQDLTNAKATLIKLLRKGFVVIVNLYERDLYDIGMGKGPDEYMNDVYGINPSFTDAQGVVHDTAHATHSILVVGVDDDQENFIVIDSANIAGICGTKRTYRGDFQILDMMAIAPQWSTLTTSGLN